MNRKRPQPEYLITDIKLVPGKMIKAIADIFPTEVNNLDGIENVDDCMIKELREANCSFICLPILFNFLNDRIPFCATAQCSERNQNVQKLLYRLNNIEIRLVCVHRPKTAFLD